MKNRQQMGVGGGVCGDLGRRGRAGDGLMEIRKG